MTSAAPHPPLGSPGGPPTPRPWTRGEALILAGIVGLSLLLRVVYVLQSRGSPFFDSPQMDALYHVEWARALAAGERFQEGPFFRAPLYPWFLAGLFRAFGEPLLLPRLVQSGLGAVCTWLVYALARRSFGRAPATVAALLSATYWVTIFYDGELLLEALATPLYLLALWWTPGLGASQVRPRRAFGAGLVWGLGAITRPNVLLFLPLLAVWLTRRSEGSGRARLLPAALLGLGVLLPILPLTAYNARAGDRVLISSQAGVNLWIGNNPLSDGHTAIVPGTRPDWWGGFEDAIAAAEQAAGRELRPSEVSRHYSRRAFEFARANPGAWTEQLLWKLRLFWMNWELGNNEEPRFLARRFSPLMRWLPTNFALLAALALVGLVAGRRRAARDFPLWGFGLVFMLSVVLFFVNARFRLPVLPLLMIYAGSGAVALWQRARGGRWGSACAYFTLGALAYLASDRVPALLVLETEANAYLRLGQAEARAGRPRAGLELYAEALEVYGRHVGPDPERAEQGAEQRVGGFADVVDRAVHAAWMDLGRGYFEREEYTEAAGAFEQALLKSPRSFDAAFSLGKSRLGAGADPGARAAFERALVSGKPSDPSYLLEAYREAARLASEAGDTAAALALTEHMVERFPDHPRAAELLRRLRALDEQ